MQANGLKRELGLWTAILVVIASMIGGGIFGLTGIIQAEVNNPILVMALWFLGGLVALSGALSYAELATMMPHAGGEYVYLKNTYGYMPSFLTGWVSFIVGFSAPAAYAGLLSGEYVHEFLKIVAPGSLAAHLFESALNRKFYAILLILLFTFFHMRGAKKGGAIQNVLGFLKLSLIFFFAISGLVVALHGSAGIPVAEAFHPRSTNWSGFGVGLLFVMFAYSGWNGATYLAEEIRDPDRNLPRALFWGTFLTMLLYLMMNAVYYLAIPAGRMANEQAVAALAASRLFGNNVTVFFNLAFCLMLLSSLSVSIMIGPRVYFAMARDNLFFRAAGELHPSFGTPVVSFLLQALLAVLYILTGSYDQITAYMQFALFIFPVLTVFGVIVLRRKRPELRRPYQTPLFPLLPVVFILFSLAIMVTSFVGRPRESTIAIAVVLAGIPIYYSWIYFLRRRGSDVIPGEEGPPSR